MVDTVLLILAAVCFALVALEIAVHRLNLLGLGLFLFVASLLL